MEHLQKCEGFSGNVALKELQVNDGKQGALQPSLFVLDFKEQDADKRHKALP